MIKFFRKIRQRLLTQNKFSQYMLCAIGEIVLVVIGILIALQINTWNEGRNARANEKKTNTRLRRSKLKINRTLLLSEIADLKEQLEKTGVAINRESTIMDIFRSF